MKALFYLLLVYYILDMLFPHGNAAAESMRILPQITMAVCCIYCLCVAFKNNTLIGRQNLFKPYWALLILALLYVVYPFEDMALFYNNFIFFLKSYMAIIFMLALFVFLDRQPKSTITYIYKLYVVQLIYGFYKLFADRAMFNDLGEHNLFDSNAGFMLICLLPMALILPKHRLRLYVFVAVILGCVYSGQRSAALAAVLCTPFCFAYLKNSIKKSDIFILVLAIIFVIAPVLQDAFLNIQLRNEHDIDSGSFGSGRSIFWKHIWDGFWDGNVLQLLFGNGTNSVPVLLRKTYGMTIGAHSGWLDALYTFGLIGFCIYASTLFMLLQKNKFVNKRLPYMKNMLLILFVLFFVKSTTSHGYWDITVMPFSMVLAIIVNRLWQQRKLTCK